MELIENPNFMEGSQSEIKEKILQEKEAEKVEVLGRKGIILGKLVFALFLLGLFLLLKSFSWVCSGDLR